MRYVGLHLDSIIVCLILLLLPVMNLAIMFCTTCAFCVIFEVVLPHIQMRYASLLIRSALDRTSLALVLSTFLRVENAPSCFLIDGNIAVLPDSRCASILRLFFMLIPSVLV